MKRGAGQQGDYRWQRLAGDVVEIAYHPATTRDAPELRDVVASTADLPAAIARLAQGFRPRVVGVWTP